METDDLVASPVLCTRDELLAAEIQRLAAAAAIAVRVVPGTSDVLRHWSIAPVVLVGIDALDELATLAPPQRSGVHAIALGGAADRAFRQALTLGAQSVWSLPESESALLELLTDLGDAASGASYLPGITVGVMAGSGGAGASVFACALALEAACVAECALIDLDPCGPGSQRLLGRESAEEGTGICWDAFMHSRGRLSARSLRSSLPASDRLAVLSWGSQRSSDLDPHAVREVMSAASRGYARVVIDLPRHPDVVLDEVVARCDAVALVTRTHMAAVAATATIAGRLRVLNPYVGLVVRGTASQASDVASLLRLPIRAVVRDQRRLDECIDLGAGPIAGPRSRLSRAARLCWESIERAHDSASTGGRR